MRDINELRGKKIMVVGLGKTGFALSKFLIRCGADVTISDHKSKAELLGVLEDLEGLNVNYDLSGHTPKLLFSQEIVILSPGVSPQLKIFEYAKRYGVHITGELEFVSQYIDVPIIAVTGTNGKTTVSTLIYKFLNASGIKTWMGGGEEPLSAYFSQDEPCKVVVVETSSFQLEHCETLEPHNIVFTNLSENHLDRYRTMERYINAKRRIFKNVSHDVSSILNADDSAVVELARDPSIYQRCRLFYFSRQRHLREQVMKIGGAILSHNDIHVRREQKPRIEKFSLEKVKLKGRHSCENIMASILAAKEQGAKDEAIQQVMDNFIGLPHRLEYIGRINGVYFYNDSKSTNVQSVVSALEAIGEDIILIMGGKDTGFNYDPLSDLVKKKVKTLFLIGEAKEKINRYIGNSTETFLIGTFEEAVVVAYQKSRIGDKVLLSPGCSSLDLFDSYKERGNYFREIVGKFRKKKV